MKILSITVDKLPSACIACGFLRNGFCAHTKENVNSVCQTKRGDACILSTKDADEVANKTDEKEQLSMRELIKFDNEVDEIANYVKDEMAQNAGYLNSHTYSVASLRLLEIIARRLFKLVESEASNE